jgi:hypothetical protein
MSTKPEIGDGYLTLAYSVCLFISQGEAIVLSPLSHIIVMTTGGSHSGLDEYHLRVTIAPTRDVTDNNRVRQP